MNKPRRRARAVAPQPRALSPASTPAAASSDVPAPARVATRSGSRAPGEATRTIRVVLVSALGGGATLAGEVLGARLLRPMVGSTAVAQSGAVAGVLAGLGLGAHFAGAALARGRDTPVRVLSLSLAALAALALLGPALAVALTAPAARAVVALGDAASPASTLARTSLAVLLTLPFGVLSGAGYPALAALHGRGAGRATAVPGAASSLGAALATLAAAFVVAPALGVRAGIAVCAGLYAVAFALARTFAGQPVPPESEEGAALPSDNAPPHSPSALALARDPLLAGAALLGFASIAWQLGLGRLGVLAFGPSAFALAAATAAHTAAFGLGEALCARAADRFAAPRRALAWVVALGALGAVGATALAAHLPAWSAARFATPGVAPSVGRLWTGAFALLVALTAPVVALLGAALPLAARALAHARALPRARANARALAATAVGNTAAALAVPLALLPRLTLAGVLLLAAGVLALAALLFGEPRRWLAPRETRAGRAVMLAAALAALAYGGARAARGWDATSLARGPFLYTGAENAPELGQLVEIAYGREATVAVRRDEAGAVLLQIDGKVDATSGGDAPTQTLVGLIPAVLCAHPRRALVIGLGSGMTVDAVRDVPGVERVDVTEVLPEVVRAARGAFRQANHDVLGSGRVHLRLEDAALYVRGARETYDVIVSEPSNPWVVGMADLFTLEALAAMRARLAPGGVAAAWMHAYSTDAATFAGVLATFREVFPRAALVELVAGQDYMVVGMADPVAVDTDRLARVLAAPQVAQQLARAGVDGRGALFGRFVAGADGLRAITREGELLHADDLRLEFRAPALLYADAASDVFALLGRAQDLPLAGLGPTGASYAALIDETEPVRDAALHARQMALMRNAGDLNGAIREGEQAVAAAPGDDALRSALARVYSLRAGRRYRSQHDPGGAADDLRTVLELRPNPAQAFRAHTVLGDMALTRDDFATAAREYGAALEIARVTGSQTPELHVRMAQVLAALGDGRHARAELERALRDCTSAARCAEIERARDALPREP